MNFISRCVLIALLFLSFFLEAISQIIPENAVKTGLDVLIEANFNVIEGKKAALLTNHAGRTQKGVSSVEALKNSDKFDLVAVFTPEHGFYTTIPAGRHVADDTIFGVPAYSLYGKNRRPGKALLDLCDLVLIDLQDVGIRSYTYLSAVYNVMDACAEYDKQVVILDRPNPIGGLIIDGGAVQRGSESYVGRIPVAYIHGCTFGELAEMINGEGWLSKDKSGAPRQCSLTVVRMENWERWMSWEDTGLIWRPTSPHIPTVNAIRGAATLGPLGELGVISIGIGTTSPFQYLGKPGFKTDKMAAELNKEDHPGVCYAPSRYRPFYGMHNGKDCEGLQLTFPLDNLFAPYSNGIRILLALRKVHPEFFRNVKEKSKKMFGKVMGSPGLLDLIIAGGADRDVVRLSMAGVNEFLRVRAKYLLY